MKILSRLILLFAFTLNAYSQTSSAQKTIDGDDYSINYSSEWKLDETGRNQTEFYLFYASSSEVDGNNINFMIQSLEGMDYDLASYTELSEDQIRANGKLLTSIRKSTHGTPYQELKFEAVFNGANLKFMQYYFLKDQKAYILTFTAKEDSFDTLLPKAVKIMDSFKLK